MGWCTTKSCTVFLLETGVIRYKCLWRAGIVYVYGIFSVFRSGSGLYGGLGPTTFYRTDVPRLYFLKVVDQATEACYATHPALIRCSQRLLRVFRCAALV